MTIKSQHELVCNRCGRTKGPWETLEVLGEWAKKQGWLWVSAEYHLCPKCPKEEENR